jgi:hypothetical protein
VKAGFQPESEPSSRLETAPTETMINYSFSFSVIRSLRAAWAAARRAMGTRKGEQLT